jgi:aspartate aminotransferase
MFTRLEDYEDDPIEALFERIANDRDPGKIDLGIGVYRDESGKVPVMESVRRAEQQLYARALPKSYLSPLGNQDYCRAVEALVLGASHEVIRDGRIVSAQTPGAGSALRLGAELVRDLAPGSSLWASTPVWDHQLEFFATPGMTIRRYRYYDQDNAVLDLDGMLEDLSAMKQDDLLLLHGCCHNPTGQDLTIEQWRAVCEVVNDTGAVPFVDIAYQGFGEGIETDVAGLKLMASTVPQMLVTVSSSKSFGIYRERAGLLAAIVEPGAGNAGRVRRKIRDHARQLYFMAPDHGAAIVHEILSTPALDAMWRDELDHVRHHVVEMRKALRRTIEAANPGFDASFIERQHGMFSCLPISAEEQRRMERDDHIYMLPNARVNVAAMIGNQAQSVAAAFARIRADREPAAERATA